MAHAAALLEEKVFSCVICLDLLKDPLTLPCGHNYCRRCVQIYKDGQEEGHHCPQCRSVQTKNTLSDVEDELKKSGPQACPGDVLCDVCSRGRLRAVRSCVQCVSSYCDTHLQPHYQSAALTKHQLVAPSSNIQNIICSEHNKVKKIFCCTDRQLICEICCMDQHKDHHTMMSSEEVLEKIRDKEIEPESLPPTPLSEPEPSSREDFLQYAQELTLDPNTAHREMQLSRGNRQAEMLDGYETLPYHPARFRKYHQVLSKQALTGRCYWEVEWEGTGCVLALSYKNINRKGEFSKFGRTHSWALYKIMTTCQVFHHGQLLCPIIYGPVASRIGVYLDHSAGVLSFYGVSETNEMNLIYRVQTTFTQPLYAGIGFALTGRVCFSKLQ